MLPQTCSAVLLMAVLGMVQGITKENYPRLSSSDCWKHTSPRPGNLRLCDPNNIVSDEQADELQKAAAEIRDMRVCPCSSHLCKIARLTGRDRGYTVTIALVNTMDISQKSNLVAVAGNYTNYLRTNRGYYGPEFSRCGDDIIIFVAWEQEVVYVMTGPTARSVVTDGEIRKMINDATQEFKRQVADGVKFLLGKIKEEILKSK